MRVYKALTPNKEKPFKYKKPTRLENYILSKYPDIVTEGITVEGAATLLLESGRLTKAKIEEFGYRVEEDNILTPQLKHRVIITDEPENTVTPEDNIYNMLEELTAKPISYLKLSTSLKRKLYAFRSIAELLVWDLHHLAGVYLFTPSEIEELEIEVCSRGLEFNTPLKPFVTGRPNMSDIKAAKRSRKKSEPKVEVKIEDTQDYNQEPNYDEDEVKLVKSEDPPITKDTILAAITMPTIKVPPVESKFTLPPIPRIEIPQPKPVAIPIPNTPPKELPKIAQDAIPSEEETAANNTLKKFREKLKAGKKDDAPSPQDFHEVGEGLKAMGEWAVSEGAELSDNMWKVINWMINQK